MKQKIWGGRCLKVQSQQWDCAKNMDIVLLFYEQTFEFVISHRPYVILEIGVAVLVIVFLFYFLITRGNPPKDALFFGN